MSEPVIPAGGPRLVGATNVTGTRSIQSRIGAALGAADLLALAEEVVADWVRARGEEPTGGEREGFRLLALHHQGARGVPSFNACRETCREIAWHYNLLAEACTPAQAPPRRLEAGGPSRHLEMMRLLVRHLAYFVHGKMEVERLGEFCCASRPLRAESAIIAE